MFTPAESLGLGTHDDGQLCVHPEVSGSAACFRAKSVVVLGSTGSIGRSALDVITASGGAHCCAAGALTALAQPRSRRSSRARLARPALAVVLERPRGRQPWLDLPVPAGEGSSLLARTGSDPPRRGRAGS